MALIDVGQPYICSAPSFAVAVNSGTNYDLIQIATAALVPVFLTRFEMTSNATAAAIQGFQWVRRSTASTTGTSVTPAHQGGGPAASTTVAYNLVTTLGTVGNLLSASLWNEFAPNQFDLTPRGILIPAASWLCLFVATPPGVTFNAAFSMEFIEIK